MDVQPADATKDSFQGREILVYTPANLPAAGNRAMVVVLHGGMGNANNIYTTFGAEMNKAADEGGFIVAYLNGTQASRLGEKFHAWNAGGCCGQPSENKVDDVAYISRAVHYLADKYDVDSKKIFGMGHSNGAMMTQRLMCETDLYQAAIPISGPLALDTAQCPAAKGKRILSIHGTVDENVPINGGYGTKGLSKFEFISEDESKRIFTTSGAEYTIDPVEGADHSPPNIMQKIQEREGRSFGQYAALFFGLAPKH
jgi:polyhydroxybutyrate depolymerase